MAKDKLWPRIRGYFRQLATDLEKESVSAAGPSHASCCQVPPEVLEEKREQYREIARNRKN